MKKLKRMLSLLAAVIMMLSTLTLSVSAAPAATGKITLNNDKTKTNVSINGKQYSAYRILDLKQNDAHTTYAYTLNEAFEGLFSYTKFTTAFPDSGVDVNKNSTIYNFISGLRNKDVEKFANVVYEYIQSGAVASTNAVTVTAANEKAEFTNLPLGYYIIYGTATDDNNGTVITACSLDTTTWDEDEGAYELNIDVKVGVPTIAKDIVQNKGAANEALVKADSDSIGETVDFRITSEVPDLTGYTKYQFIMTDNLSNGLTYIKPAAGTGMVVKIGSATIDPSKYTVETSTNATTGVTTITVTFTDFYTLIQTGTGTAAYAAGTKITFDYSATINKDAVIGADGNPNTAKITYSNDPHKRNTPDEADNTTTTKEETVKVYVFKYNIYKYTNIDTANTPLQNAKFELKKSGSASAITFVDLGSGNYRVATAAEIADTNTTTTTTLVSPAGGNIVLSGLGAGKYSLKETEAPAGYNLLEDEIAVNIEPTYTNANLTSLKAAASTEDYEVVQESSKLVGIKTEVENKSGAKLPNTGGMGTTILYTIGIALVACAMIALIVRKMANNE